MALSSLEYPGRKGILVKYLNERRVVMKKKIVVDIGGADAAPDVLVKGAVMAVSDQDDYDLVIAGPEQVTEKAVCDAGKNAGKDIRDRIEILAAEKAVTNHDDPAKVVVGCEDTSMVAGLMELKKRDDLIGMVSAGSTGPLMIASKYRLGLLGGLKQPALASALRDVNGEYICLVDCGANINCKAKDYMDYAHMGSAFMAAMKRKAAPSVGLLNVGKERTKGTERLTEIYDLLEQDDTINFIGNIEGSDVISGAADVIVCDGFSGNILLKSMEAVGMTAAKMMGNPENVVRLFDYNGQGGATFLGTKKIVVKAHGAAQPETIYACINQAWRMESGGFTLNIAERLTK